VRCMGLNVVHGGPRPPAFSHSRFMCTKCTDHHHECLLLLCFSRRCDASGELPHLAHGGGSERLLMALRPRSVFGNVTKESMRRIGVSRGLVHGGGGSVGAVSDGKTSTVLSRSNSPLGSSIEHNSKVLRPPSRTSPCGRVRARGWVCGGAPAPPLLW
jgi:hypothetical protein